MSPDDGSADESQGRQRPTRTVTNKMGEERTEVLTPAVRGCPDCPQPHPRNVEPEYHGRNDWRCPHCDYKFGSVPVGWKDV